MNAAELFVVAIACGALTAYLGWCWKEYRRAVKEGHRAVQKHRDAQGLTQALLDMLHDEGKRA